MARMTYGAAVTCCSWSDDGSILLCGGEGGSISIWRFSQFSGDLGSTAAVRSGTSSGGGRGRGNLNRSSGRSSRPASRAVSPASRAASPNSRAASPNSRAASPAAHSPRPLELVSADALVATCTSGSGVSCCAWHYNGEQLLTGHDNGDVLLWSVKRDKLEQGLCIAVRSDPPRSCAVWPGEAHDLVLISSPRGIEVVQAVARVRQDKCGVRYVVSALPQVRRW